MRELLDTYAAADPFDGDCGSAFHREQAAQEAFAALRAVLDRHTPAEPDWGRSTCAGCATHATFAWWPCDTVKDIETALRAGVDR